VTEAAIANAMAVHAAFGGSTNWLLHLPAVAHAAHLPRPTAARGSATASSRPTASSLTTSSSRPTRPASAA